MNNLMTAYNGHKVAKNNIVGLFDSYAPWYTSRPYYWSGHRERTEEELSLMSQLIDIVSEEFTSEELVKFDLIVELHLNVHIHSDIFQFCYLSSSYVQPPSDPTDHDGQYQIEAKTVDELVVKFREKVKEFANDIRSVESEVDKLEAKWGYSIAIDSFAVPFLLHVVDQVEENHLQFKSFHEFSEYARHVWIQEIIKFEEAAAKRRELGIVEETVRGEQGLRRYAKYANVALRGIYESLSELYEDGLNTARLKEYLEDAKRYAELRRIDKL